MNISLPALQRLPRYLNLLRDLKATGQKTISASQIGAALGVQPILVRKDLAGAGLRGVPKVGHQIEVIIEQVQEFLNWNNTTDAFLIGYGKLGAALVDDGGCRRNGINIVAAFDIDPHKVEESSGVQKQQGKDLPVEGEGQGQGEGEREGEGEGEANARAKANANANAKANANTNAKANANAKAKTNAKARVKVLPLEKLKNLAERMRIHIGIITVPAEAAQSVADQLVEAGIFAIWNFAPVQLNVPSGVIVETADFYASLAVLSRRIIEQKTKPMTPTKIRTKAKEGEGEGHGTSSDRRRAGRRLQQNM